MAQRGDDFWAVRASRTPYSRRAARQQNQPRLKLGHCQNQQYLGWVYDESGETDDCVKVRDDHTGRLAIWLVWLAARRFTPAGFFLSHGGA